MFLAVRSGQPAATATPGCGAGRSTEPSPALHPRWPARTGRQPGARHSSRRQHWIILSVSISLPPQQGHVCFRQPISTPCDGQRGCAPAGARATHSSSGTVSPSWRPTERHQPRRAVLGTAPWQVRPSCRLGHLSLWLSALPKAQLAAETCAQPRRESLNSQGASRVRGKNPTAREPQLGLSTWVRF